MINFESDGTTNNFIINNSVVINYYRQLLSIKEDLNIDSPFNILDAVMRLPDTLKIEDNEISEEEWQNIEGSIDKTLAGLDDYREKEGKILEDDILNRILKILNLAESINNFEKVRIDNIKSRLRQNLAEFIDNNEYDHNRFEQELIYYLEKIDITEEKVRLKNHCNYFIETAGSNFSTGKKLGFICQEIGREINTLGAKANDSNVCRKL